MCQSPHSDIRYSDAHVLALSISLFCTMPFYCVYAQNQKAAGQPTEAPAAEQNSPSPTPTSTTVPEQGSSVAPPPTTVIAPLTIEQIRANLPAAPAERFEFIRRQRKNTLEAMDEASTQLKALSTSISLLQKQKEALSEQTQSLGPTREEFESDKKHSAEALAHAEQQLNAAKAKAGVSQADLEKLQKDVDDRRDKMDVLEGYESRLKANEERRQAAEDTVKRTTAELSRQNAFYDKATQSQLAYQRLLGEIDDMANQLFIASDASNSFKLKMSIYFALLVAIVIVGFFTIAFSNEDVKKSIFSNEAGIQFITMFAIVIAVILFGIIGILESKELSALLGGLSGYILGKSRSSS